MEIRPCLFWQDTLEHCCRQGKVVFEGECPRDGGSSRSFPRCDLLSCYPLLFLFILCISSHITSDYCLFCHQKMPTSSSAIGRAVSKVPLLSVVARDLHYITPNMLRKGDSTTTSTSTSRSSPSSSSHSQTRHNSTSSTPNPSRQTSSSSAPRKSQHHKKSKDSRRPRPSRTEEWVASTS